MSCSARSRTGLAAGFSLLELMVVIVIITILIAVLLPALSQARQLAISTNCTANLRQLGIAVGSYGNTIYIPPAQNTTYQPPPSSLLGQNWDDILNDDGLLNDVRVLQCPMADHQVGTDYAFDASGNYNPANCLIVNSRYRLSAPALTDSFCGLQSANSNYNVNGGPEGGGTIDFSVLGGLTGFCHPWRYVIQPWDQANPTYSNSPWISAYGWPGGEYGAINGYAAFWSPMKKENVPDPSSTISLEDGGYLQSADYIAPRHGGSITSSDRWCLSGQWFNVLWIDGHASPIQRGSSLYAPFVGNIPTTWSGPMQNFWTMRTAIPSP